MLHGMIQPLFFARYAQSGDFQDMGNLANMTFRVSLIALGLPTVVLLAGGAPLLDFLTAGKYGPAANLAAGMMLVLSLESLRSQIEVMVQAVERNEVFLLSNLALSSSLPIALFLLPHLNLWSFVIGSGLGNVFSLVVLTAALGRIGHRFHLDWWMTFRALVAILAAGLLGAQAASLTTTWMGILLSVLSYALITRFWPPIRPAEMSLIAKIVRRKSTSATL